MYNPGCVYSPTGQSMGEGWCFIRVCFHLWVLSSFPSDYKFPKGPDINSEIVIGLSTDFFPCFLFKVQKVATIMNEMQLPMGL